jgi:geranylgeranyl diphosphate synthase type I
MVEKMESLKIRPQIQTVIDVFLEEQKPILDQVSPAAGELADFAANFLAGGKRLRAAFCYWGYIGSGGEETSEILKAASALEFLQGCALVHDDVMDASDTRRGSPAIHKRFEQMHQTGNWAGSESLFGVGGAVLLGDLLLSWADQVLMTSGFSDEKLSRAKNIYDTMRTELMAGQYLDLYNQAKRGGTIEEAFNVIRFKSAKYTIERPLHLGCALAVNDKNLINSFSQYGLPLGEAFQLRDDLLGVFGDPAETGKPAGDDLREGKRTVLMEIAFNKSSPAQRQLLDQLFAKPDLSDVEVAELREVIQLTGALNEVEGLIAERLSASQAALEVSSITDEAKKALFELAIASTTRRL